MDEKLSREKYRVETYGGPTGRPVRSSLISSVSDSSAQPGLSISTDRAIIQFDADAFYGELNVNRQPQNGQCAQIYMPTPHKEPVPDGFFAT